MGGFFPTLFFVFIAWVLGLSRTRVFSLGGGGLGCKHAPIPSERYYGKRKSVEGVSGKEGKQMVDSKWNLEDREVKQLEKLHELEIKFQQQTRK